MGFEFSETMAGTVEWDAEPGQRYPFRFDVTAHADSVKHHLFTGHAELHGTVLAPPKARQAPAEGTIMIRPLGGRIIRYELAFTGDDGERYTIVGQKDIDFLRPRASFTNLPVEILDAHHERVGTAQTRFDLRRDWWKFLRSFRPA